VDDRVDHRLPPIQAQIEGFRQKIPLHDKLTNLGVQLRQAQMMDHSKRMQD
jgi:hypothetical protein